ncbi:hypothetical protein CHS0354_030304, partial [Potamilus streckersoni]
MTEALNKSQERAVPNFALHGGGTNKNLEQVSAKFSLNGGGTYKSLEQSGYTTFKIQSMYVYFGSLHTK